MSVAETASDHKAIDLRILEVFRHCDYADYFVIMSASSTRHAKALADSILETSGSSKVPEGYQFGEWVLIDLGDVVVHIFNEPQRYYYNFDRLWGHVPILETADAPRRPAEDERRAGHPM
ncbi:MAG: ribosome silencing factor [Pseudomonadota bacterium]